MSFDKAEYNKAYNKERYAGISFRINKETEKDIAEALKGQRNIKEYICKLIRADVKRQRRRKGWAMNNGDRKIHADVQRYPFEVIEFLANNDRYTIGFTQSLDAAESMLAWYVSHNEDAGPVSIYCRKYDERLHAPYAVQVY